MAKAKNEEKAGSKKSSNAKKKDKTSEEVSALKKKLNSDASIQKKKKKEVSPEQKAEKKRKHVEKIVEKQKARLPEHIERIKRKEQKGQPANKERFYVTNVKLLEQLEIWKNTPPDKDGIKQIPVEFGKMIQMIAERLTNHSNFKNYTREMKQDMVSYAKYKCFQGIGNYNFDYKNAFAYFTTACYNAFVSEISRYYKKKNLDRDVAKRALEKLESTADVNSSKILSQFLKDYLGEDIAAEETEEKKEENE